MLPGLALLLALASAALCGLAAWQLAQVSPLEAAGSSLMRAHALAEGLRVERAKRLLAGAELAGLDPAVAAALEGKAAGPGAAAEALVRIKPALRADLLELASRDGRLLARLDAAGPQALTAPAQAEPALARAAMPLAPVAGEGWAIESDGQLYEAVSGPVMSLQKVLGGLRLGLAWGLPQALALRQATGCDVALLAPGKVLASSLSPMAEAALLALLTSRAADRAALQADLGLGPQALRAWPLLGPEGRAVASLVLLEPCAPRGGESLPFCIYAAAACALLAALALLARGRAGAAPALAEPGAGLAGMFKATAPAAGFAAARQCPVMMLAMRPDALALALQEELPEGWALQMSDQAAWLSEVVQDHGGLLARAPEGCLLALWRLEDGADGHAAVEAAMEMLDRAGHLDQVLRLGLHLGSALLAELGAPGQRGLCALGPEPGLAWEVAAKAAPNQVLASEPAYRQVRNSYEFNRVEALGRGSSAPLQIFEVLGRKGA
jgi:hypothetical protein